MRFCLPFLFKSLADVPSGTQAARADAILQQAVRTGYPYHDPSCSIPQ